MKKVAIIYVGCCSLLEINNINHKKYIFDYLNQENINYDVFCSLANECIYKDPSLQHLVKFTKIINKRINKYKDTNYDNYEKIAHDYKCFRYHLSDSDILSSLTKMFSKDRLKFIEFKDSYNNCKVDEEEKLGLGSLHNNNGLTGTTFYKRIQTIENFISTNNMDNDYTYYIYLRPDYLFYSNFNLKDHLIPNTLTTAKHQNRDRQMRIDYIWISEKYLTKYINSDSIIKINTTEVDNDIVNVHQHDMNKLYNYFKSTGLNVILNGKGNRIGVGEYFFLLPVKEKNIYHTKKISIVMAYFNRKEQLKMTLESIKKSNYSNKEIIIVDDNSRPDQRVETFIDEYKKWLDIKVITIEEKEKKWVNPCMPYNIGIKDACGDIVILQNPEVMHVGDCLTFVNDNLEEKDWISFNCYGSHGYEFNKEVCNSNSSDIFNKINKLIFREGGNSVLRDDVGGWLNHYEKHFVGYHYLAAIHKSDLKNYLHPGFNEKFKYGIGGDDDELIKRLIYNNFNFKISPFKSEKPFCVHLYHEKPEQVKNLDYRVNLKHFKESCKNMKMTPENNIYKAPKNEIPMAKRILI